MVRWSAERIRERRGEAAPPKDVGESLKRLGLEAGGFIESLQTFSRSFFTMVGHVHQIDTESRRRGYRRRPGIPAAERLYRKSAA